MPGAPFTLGTMKHTKRHIQIGILLLLSLVLFAACGNGEAADADQRDARDAETEAADEATDEADELVVEDGVVIIEMHTRGGGQYNDPLGVHIEPGTTVRWVQLSGSHTVTAYHADNGRDQRMPGGAAPFDSGVMAGRNAEFEVTFEHEGVYDYVCTLHEAQGHVGRIVVGDPDAHPAEPSDGLPGRAGDFLVPVEDIVERGHVSYASVN